ncbi:phosphotransferase [Corynebacterium liangguodongii]|uniref:Aminoglycoside phosphotransferase domain-containing protein n=1 Tax=Corynebacterium liangguodongii TaxID=2079535 RepID=A0A2S0WEU2_9CORY|nr:phosphotransferase [Corynebacterium liangguodongii]AWB84291.1 hypothetical protein C3E79_07190 [Corynebacterium liangguodongii]PWB98584.1 hypothetical protein DF219_11165 [Corynebacterium liangguodongii]
MRFQSRMAGRNEFWVYTDARSGRQFFKKKFVGDGAALRYHKCKAAGSIPGIDKYVATPCVVEFDDEQLALVFEHVSGFTMFDMILTQKLEIEHGRVIGDGLARFHLGMEEALPIAEEKLGLSQAPFSPAWAFLECPKFAELGRLSSANLQLLRIVQRDDALLDALKDTSIDTDPVITHHDLRGNQLLLNENGVYFVDLEEIALGYVEGDVGALLGELYLRALMDVWTDRIDHQDFDATMDARDQAGRFELAKKYYAPIATALLQTYSDSYKRPIMIDDVATEMLRFMLNRLITTNMWRSTMSPRTSALLNGVSFLARDAESLKEFVSYADV